MALPPAVREGVWRLLHATEAARIVRLAEKAGLTVVLYKGAALAEMAYGGSENRHSSDIDLLVKAEDYGAVDRLLVLDGFLPWRPIPAWLLQASRWGAPTLPYEMHYRNASTNVEVDLHTGLLPKDMSSALDERALWRRLERVELFGRSVPTLGTIDTLLFLALHGTKHQWDGERYAQDFAAFARARVTPEVWRHALAEAELGGCRDALLVAVRIAEEQLEFSFPEEISGAARRSPRVGRIAAWFSGRFSHDPGASFTTAGVFLGGWRMWDTLPQRLIWLLKRLGTPNVFDYGWIQLPASLGFLYYLVRPVRLAWQWTMRPVLAWYKRR